MKIKVSGNGVSPDSEQSEQELELLMDYRKVFGTPSGQNVLQDLMRQHNMLNPSFVATDPHTTSWNEGRRAVMIQILQYLNYDIKKLMTAIKEANNV